MPSFPVDKLSDEALRELALGEGDGPVSVLIGLDLPERGVEIGQIERRGLKVRSPRNIRRPTAAELETTERLITEGKEFLRRVLGGDPVWIPAARAFAAEVSGEQLRRIAASPLTKRIYLNRRLR